jgi:SAM-dependent methyltransferase
MVSQFSIIQVVFVVFIVTYVLAIARFGIGILHNKNIFLQFALWVVAFSFAFYTRRAIFLVIPPIISMVNEWAYHNYNKDLYDGNARVKLFYDLATRGFVEADGGDPNFTEGAYLDRAGNTLRPEVCQGIDAQESLEIKFREIWRIFGLNRLNKKQLASLRILDMGCGNGEFLRFCRSQGVSATGVTISSEQARSIREKGLDVMEGSFVEYHPELAGRYDIIIFMGSLEHLAQGLPCHSKTRQKQVENWSAILGICRRYFKDTTPYRLLFSSTLHLNPKYCGTTELNMLERAFGGAYQFDVEGDRLADIANRYGYETTLSRDMTYHYYMSSIVSKTHFGRPSPMTNEKGLLMAPTSLFIQPSIYYMMMYGYYGLWMWQFDGKRHLYREGIDTCQLLPREERPVTLWWDILSCRKE